MYFRNSQRSNFRLQLQTMNNSPTQFWNWFSENNKPYLFIHQVDLDERERLLDDLMKELHKYCDELFFEMGGHPDDVQELIITAEGNKKNFAKVEDLVDAAPEIQGWKIIAFIPPRDADFEINFEGVLLKPSEMWFFPLQNEKDLSKAGIRVFIKNYELLKEKSFFTSALYKVLDVILGEKSFALDLDYVDADDLSDEPEEMGLSKLEMLPQFIQWYKSKFQ